MTTCTPRRLAFAEAVSLVRAWEEGEPEPVVELEGRTLPVSILCERMSRDTDLMPNAQVAGLRDLADDADLPSYRPTYGAGARLLRRIVTLS